MLKLLQSCVRSRWAALGSSGVRCGLGMVVCLVLVQFMCSKSKVGRVAVVVCACLLAHPLWLLNTNLNLRRGLPAACRLP